MKRLMALMLSLTFLLTALPLGAVSVAAEEDRPYLELGVVTEVVRGEDGYAYFYFTPAESGYHIFKSVHTGQGNAFAYGAVCNILGATLKSDWDIDEQGNFRVAYDMTAGETYLLRAEIYNVESFSVCIVKEEPRTITNVEFLDDTILLEDIYDLESRMRVTYSDGTVEEIIKFYYIQDDLKEYFVPTNSKIPTSQWEVGGTYTVHAYVYEPGGDEKLWESDYTLTVAETPVASVEIEPIVCLENKDGYWTTDRVWNQETGEYVQSPEYFYYYDGTPDYEDVTITLEDGTIIEGTFFEWNGREYAIRRASQSYENRLLPGVNERTYSIADYEGTYIVNIVKSPVVSVEMEPIPVIEHCDGEWTTDEVWNEELGTYVESPTYFNYDFSPHDYVASVTMCDGTIIDLDDHFGRDFYWNGQWYYFEFERDSYENQLQLGVNELTYSIAGYEGTYTVEVVDTPVASHWAAPIRIQENQYGYWVDAGDEETGDTTGERYFHYNNLESAIRSHLFLTMKNGIQQFADDSEYYVEVEQSYENRLLPGLNEVTFSIAGYTGTCTVEVVESSVASVEVEPIVYTQYADATVDYEWSWDEETQQDIRIPYFHYDVRPETITLTFKDGTAATYAVQNEWWMDDPFITHNGEEYAISWDDGSYYNRDWGVGVHTVSASVMGCQFTYTVEIVERDTDSVYEYIPAEGGIIITDCYFPEETMEIPATIDGKTVIGVADLPYEVKHLTLPDTVATIDDWLLSGLVSVSFGAGVRNLHAGMFEHAYDLQSVTIDPANPYFTVIDGAVYDKAGTTFIGYPMKGEDLTHTVPRTAVDLGALNFRIYDNLSVTLEEGNPNAVTIDGVTYDKGMTRVLFCDPDKEGVYVMPSTVTDIAEAAFRGCSKLTEVTISPSVTTIVYCAFQWCSGIEVLNLPEGLVSIERYAFADTTSLESVDLPETLETIGSLAFEDSGLTSLTLPDATKEVYYSAFRYSNIATLDLGSGVEYIGEEVFCGTPVESVALPHSLTYLGSGAFSGCGNLKSVSIGQGLTAIRDRTFSHSGLESITIPANVQSIGYYAFAYCDSLRQVILTNGLESIGEEAFYHNPALEEIVIPDSVTYLGWRAFKWCESLTRAVIGAGITYIDEDTFAHCPLEEVDFRGRLETIGAFAFTDGNMTSIAIPDSVTSIMYGAFLGCEQLEEIHLPPSVMDLGGGAFHDTAWYAAQPEGMTYLAHAAYYWKGDMAPDTAVTIPEEITLLADWVLADQYNLTAVDLPESLRVIGDNAFRQDINLTTLYLGKNVERVQELAFYRCYGLTDVYYTGSEADRAAMVIEDYNDPLLNATWHYNICADDAHVYDNYCDNTCNRCDWVRPDAPGHTYRNQCDADCNNCGLTRTPPHKYGDACDAACNGCGLTREPPHQYTDKYDAECDLCGAVREVTLVVYGDANGDNKVNVRDIGVIQQNLNGWDVELNLDACDVNGDGKVNVRDLGLIQQFINGWDVQLGPQK